MAYATLSTILPRQGATSPSGDACRAPLPGNGRSEGSPFMHIYIEPNALYYGDCLDIMAAFPDEYVDLIYLDPPFNSDEKYNTIFKGRHGLRNIDPQIKAFDDTWTWNEASAQRVAEVKGAVANPASKVIQAFELFIPQSKMLSYTSYMAHVSLRCAGF